MDDREYSKKCKLIFSKCIVPNHPSSVLYDEHELSPLKALVYRNGKINEPVVVIANCLYQFLNIATIKLNLSRAARRLFDLKGVEIKTDAELKRAKHVFASCGESFCDANYDVVKFLHTKNAIIWSINGINLQKNNDETPSNQAQKSKMHKILIYKNGDGSEPLLVALNGTEDLKEIEGQCRIKFDWHSPIKGFVNWNGEKLNSSEEMIDFSLDNYEKFSPIWVLNEVFNPSGCLSTIEQVRSYLIKWRDSDRKYSFLEYNDSERRLFKNFTSRIQGLPDDFLDGLFNFLTLKRRELKKRVKEYEQNDKNIKEVSTSDAIFGGFSSKGLKLQCFLNGTDTKLLTLHFNLKGLSHLTRKNVQMGIVLLLEEINRQLEKEFKASSKRFCRVFNERGDEINRLDKLEYNQKIWLSKGDDFKSSVLNVLSLKLSTVTIYETQEDKLRLCIQNCMLKRDDRLNKNTKWNYYELKSLIHDLKQRKKNNVIEKISQEYALDGEMPLDYIDNCLKCSESNLILFPEVQFDKRELQASFYKSPKDTQLFGWSQKDIQSWIIHKNGHITSKIFPSCYLSVFAHQSLTLELVHQIDDDENTETLVMKGYVVRLKPCDSNREAEEWKFNALGQIYSESKGDGHVLTCLEILKNDLERCAKNQIIQSFNLRADFDEHETNRASLVIFEQVKINSNSLTSSQRWAIKEKVIPITENTKNSKLSTPLWHELFYCWPVDEYNQLIKEFTWPLCGFLLPGAPSLKKVSNKLLKQDSIEEIIVNPKELMNSIINDSHRLFFYHDLMVQMSLKMTIQTNSLTEDARVYVSAKASPYNQFTFDRRNGVIHTKSDKNLVIGVRKSTDQTNELILTKRNDGDRTQQWMECGNDMISLKINSKAMIGIDLKTPLDDQHRVILNNKPQNDYLNAENRVKFSEIDGTLNAFSVSLDTKQLYAASKANICTGYLFNYDLIQLGHTIDDDSSKIFCSVCAELLRQTKNVKKLPKEHRFQCFTRISPDDMTTALQSLQDTSAGSLLDECQANILKLGKLKILNALATEKHVIEVRRNGETLKQKAVIIQGGNVEKLLIEANKLLGLQKVPSKFYTLHGAQIARTCDLVAFYTNQQTNFEFDQEKCRLGELQRFLNEMNINEKKVFKESLKLWVPIKNEKFIKP